jgi:uncharacterized membrane protein YphA (DoxX/SURF4 family)
MLLKGEGLILKVHNHQFTIMKFIPLIGRLLFSTIFMYTSISKFSDYFVYEAQSKGIPFSSLLIPLVGIFEFVAGLSILFGCLSKWGAWIIVILLLPITLVMHDFWNIEDPVLYQLTMMTFMKNISILGGALMISYFGAGPYSIDEARENSGS